MKLDPAEVQEMLASDPHMLLVDVRTEEEYDAGHIPGAGCMPVEDICDCLYDRGMELSDVASVIVLYCADGSRSCQAVQHMEAIGYVNVYDAGGIIDWPYEVVTTDEERAVAAALSACGAVAQEDAPDAGRDCGCGHDHAHDHGHGCGCGC